MKMGVMGTAYQCNHSPFEKWLVAIISLTQRYVYTQWKRRYGMGPRYGIVVG